MKFKRRTINTQMKKILLVFSAIFIAGLLQAQVQVNNELKALINQSFGYFPKVKEAENRINTAQEQLNIAQTNLPTVDGTLSYEYVQPKIVLPLQMNGETKDFQFAPVNNVNANVGANYTLFDFGRLKANVDKAKTDLRYTEHNADYVKSELANQVAVIYYNIIYFQKGVAIEDSILAFLNENKRVIQSQLENGNALKIDLLNVQSSIDQEQNRKVELQDRLQKQLNLLQYTTGSITATGVNFDFDVALKDALTLVSDAQKNNLEYVLARDRVQQAQSDLAITKTLNKPYLTVGGNAGFKNGYVPDVNQIRFNYAAGVTLRVPIYDAGKTKRETRLQETIVKQNQLAIQSLDADFNRDFVQTLTDINSNLQSIKNTEGQIAEARASQDLASSRFLNGVGTNLEITNASTNRSRAEFTRLQYQYQLCLAKLELARLLGYQYW
jgi:outer membrane protein